MGLIWTFALTIHRTFTMYIESNELIIAQIPVEKCSAVDSEIMWTHIAPEAKP